MGGKKRPFPFSQLKKGEGEEEEKEKEEEEEGGGQLLTGLHLNTTEQFLVVGGSPLDSRSTTGLLSGAAHGEKTGKGGGGEDWGEGRREGGREEGGQPRNARGSMRRASPIRRPLSNPHAPTPVLKPHRAHV